MNAFEIGIEMHLVDKVSAALGTMAMGFARTQTAITAMQARMNSIHSTFSKGVLMMGGGLALAAPLIYATHAAMDLETALGRVKIATGASNSQMDKLNDTLTLTANATGIFSKPTLAAFAADMYASGITSMDQINKMLPMFAKGADVMKIISHGKINPEEAAHTFSALAHQFGRYDEKSMRPIVQAAVAMAPALPGGLKTFKGMGSYVNVMGNRLLGVDPVELMALQAAIAQTSGGQGTGRGAMSGANLINAMKRSMPGIFGSGLLSGKSAYAAEVLGLAKGGVSTVFKNQKLDLPTLIDKLSKFESMSGMQIAELMKKHAGMLGKKAPEELQFLKNFEKTPGAPKAQLITKMLQSQFGSAGTIAQLFGEEKFKTLLKSIMDRVKAAKSIEEMQAAAMTMLGPQLMRLQTNFTTLASTIGMQMIPVITPLITKLGDMLDSMNNFASANPQVVRAIVGTTAALSGLMIVGGIGKIMQAAFMGLQFLASPAAAAVMKVVGAFRLFTPQGLLLAAAITALVVVVKNWDKIVEFAKKHVDTLKVALVFVIDAAEAAVKAFQWLGGAIQGAIGAMGGAINGFLKSINLPQIPDWTKNFMNMDGQKDYANKRLNDLGMLKGIDAWAKSRPAQDPRFSSIPMPIKNNVVPFVPPPKGAAGPTPPLFIPPPKGGVAAGQQHHHVVNNHVHIAHGAIQINGTQGDPKEHAKKIMDHIEDKTRRASAATTQAGGVDVSKHAFGSGR